MLSEAFGNAIGSGDEESAMQGVSSLLSNTDLLPAFGLQNTSHLPTPQSSPSNIAAYTGDLNGSYGSPIPSMTRDVQMGPSASRAPTPPRDDPQGIISLFITPESSPLLPRKIMPSMSPTAGPSSLPHTPARSAPEEGHISMSGTGPVFNHTTDKVVDTAVSSLAPAPFITTPVPSHSRGITPLSRLSSPFRDRLTAAERRARKSKSSSPMPPRSPMAGISSAPPSSLLPLATPIPQRALGGEIQRIHLQLATDHAERITETEARRPEYFVREKRKRSDADIPTLDELDAASATLGVTESPIKGRRLQLFQATSEETFEQSLLAGGYPAYGQSPAYKNGEPQTLVPSAKGGLSQRALQWLHQATPGQPGPYVVAASAEASLMDEPDWVPSEQEIRKRRRLDAFKNAPEYRERSSKLYPVEIEGRGRLLLNVPPEDAAGDAHAAAPAKKRVNRRKRRRGGRRGQASDPQEEVLQLNWLDSAFPWCLRVQERTHTEKMEEEERLKWIARYLDRDSDSDSAEEDQGLKPLLHSHENDQVAHRRGRGKMVPLRVNSQAATRVVSEKMLVPSDPADARAALLSKRSVRSLATRRKGAQSDEVEEVKCIGCQRGDDGSELVQCDECQTWYHLPCIGIRNVAELGREEDPWYCNKCLDIAPSSPLEPTFVPTDDRPLEPSSRRHSLFLQNTLLQSPAPTWDAEATAPQTPDRGSFVRDGEYTFSTRSSWGDSSHAGPSTPESSGKTVRVYNTPGPFALAFDRDGFDPETPFDPTSTPSRGIKFSGGPPPTLGLTTPKSGFGLWTTRGGQTPTPAKFGGTLGIGGRRHSWEDGGGAFSSPHPRSIYSAAYDDTPVTRAPRFREMLSTLSVGGRKLWEVGFAQPPGVGGGEEMVVEREGEVPMETEA